MKLCLLLKMFVGNQVADLIEMKQKRKEINDPGRAEFRENVKKGREMVKIEKREASL